MAHNLLLIGLGVLLLYGGGELLVRGSSQLARLLGMKPLIIGLTVVAFGTSSPELAATLVSTLEGAPQLALGNVLGSNVANLGLILAVSALLRPLVAEAKFIRRELPVMIGAGVILLLMMALGGGQLGWWNGLLLLLGMAVYLVILLRDGEPPAVEQEFAREFGPTRGDRRQALLRFTIMIVVGIGLLVGGAEVLVRGAVAIAQAFQVSDRIIGITLVAVGTSLPELAGCLVAAWRNEGDIILGNVIGSNIFNVLLILGVTVLVRPLQVPLAEVVPDLLVMLAFSVAVVPLLLVGRATRLHRWEGLLLLLGYLAYMGYLATHLA